MSTKQKERPPPPPKLVVLNRAFKRAEQWVNGMSGTLVDESHGIELESRPSRLGIGAIAPPESQHTTFDDPAGKRLGAHINAIKRKAAKSIEDSNSSTLGDDGDSSDEELGSKADAFTKRRPVSQISFMQKGKNKKSKY